MTNPPPFAMQFTNLSAAVAYLTETLGFTLLEEKRAEDIAYVIDSDGDPLLIAGPAVKDLPSYLSAPRVVVKPGESLGFGIGDLDAWQAELSNKGITDMQVTQRSIGDRVLHVKGPDNYTFEFIQPAVHSYEELLNMYARSLDDLDEALAGLNDTEMGLVSCEGGWNIRQIVHHIADTDILFGEQMKVTLSAPGTVMERPTAVGNERITTEAEYRDRPVVTSVALFRAFHLSILDIVKYIPDAGERHIEDSNGHRYMFSQLIHTIVGHTGEHIEEIWKIRRKHGK